MPDQPSKQNSQQKVDLKVVEKSGSGSKMPAAPTDGNLALKIDFKTKVELKPKQKKSQKPSLKVLPGGNKTSKPSASGRKKQRQYYLRPVDDVAKPSTDDIATSPALDDGQNQPQSADGDQAQAVSSASPDIEPTTAGSEQAPTDRQGSQTQPEDKESTAGANNKNQSAGTAENEDNKKNTIPGMDAYKRYHDPAKKKQEDSGEKEQKDEDGNEKPDEEKENDDETESKDKDKKAEKNPEESKKDGTEMNLGKKESPELPDKQKEEENKQPTADQQPQGGEQQERQEAESGEQDGQQDSQEEKQKKIKFWQIRKRWQVSRQIVKKRKELEKISKEAGKYQPQVFMKLTFQAIFIDIIDIPILVFIIIFIPLGLILLFIKTIFSVYIWWKIHKIIVDQKTEESFVNTMAAVGIEAFVGFIPATTLRVFKAWHAAKKKFEERRNEIKELQKEIKKLMIQLGRIKNEEGR